jgi:membrane protein DedA with SNARE-associated domain
VKPVVSSRARRRLRRYSIWAGTVILLLGGLLAIGIISDVYEPLGDLPQQAFRWVRHNGPGGAVFALYAEESGVPLFLPGDVFVVYLGRHATSVSYFLIAWVALVTAVVAGATNLYWISRRWGRELLEGRLGRVVHLTPKRLDQAERWFSRYGVWALIFGRHIPGFRIPITVAAGTLKVKYRVFAASVAVSSAIWVTVFLFAGLRFGRAVEHLLFRLRINYAIAVPILLCLVGLWFGVQHFARLRRATHPKHTEVP